MSLQVLCCPTCGAPMRGTPALPTPCSYCGSLLVDRTTGDGPTEERYSLKLRVGPSNRQRVMTLLQARLGVAAPTVSALLNDSSLELEVGRDEVIARQLAREVAEAGAQAEVIVRTVPIPVAGVSLDVVGSRKVAVIVALRTHVELALDEAKRLVEGAPSVVAQSIPLPRAQALVDALVAAGARARLC